MNERTEKIEGIFHAASVLNTPDERARYLDKACSGDERMRREVEELLMAARDGDELFRFCERDGENGGKQAGPGPEQAGTVIGRYKLLEKIGEGGMGIVYMAEQEQPVRRKVALKIIKLGMDTRQVVARFEAERQALAMMDHPNIARAIDGGATETGRPYFVMELVQGVPITQFCEVNHLSGPERLKLFIPVCQAIQSAHQKGIIHRDLKPSNVLVTMHNGAPHPMVIDFGVAKAIDQKLTEKTLFTNFATVIGTPAYMSPEQAELNKLDVDTRTDIYSLGVLLYELLTGTTPFAEEHLRSVAYGEMQRIIVEEEPERPSARLKKRSLTQSVSRQVSFLSSFSADLDWIVMKCLEKDRNRRYETANALAADIQAHLNDEPVIARSPSAAYRLKKFVRRNRTAVGVGAFALIVLIAAVIVSLGQAIRATKAERSSRVVKDFLVNQVLAVNPYVDSQADPGRRILLERVASAIDERFANDPLIEAELRMVLGGAISMVGDAKTALSQFRRAFDLRQRELGLNNSDSLWSLAWTAQMETVVHGKTQMRGLMEQTAKRILDSPGSWSSGEAEIVWTYGDFILWQADRQPTQALPYLQKALAECRRASPTADYRFQNKLGALARVMEDAGRVQDAEAMWKEYLPQSETQFRPDHLIVAQFKYSYAAFLRRQGRGNEAVPLIESALPVYRRVLGPENTDTQSLEKLGKTAAQK